MQLVVLCPRFSTAVSIQTITHTHRQRKRKKETGRSQDTQVTPTAIDFDLRHAMGEFAVKCQVVKIRAGTSKSVTMVPFQKTVDR